MTAGGLPTPALLILGVAFIMLALASPKAALFVILPTIALAPETQVGLVVIRPDDVMIAILAVSWGVRRLVSTARGRTPLDQPLVLYFIIGLAATLWGAAIGTADLTSPAKFSASGLHLLKRLEFILFFFVIRDSIRSIVDARRLIYTFMAALAALSVYSLITYRQTGTIALGPSGTPIHEPGLASLLNIALALGFLVRPAVVGRAWVMLAVLVGSLYTLPFGLGRNYLSATLLMLVIVAVWRKRPILLLLPITTLVISVVGVTLFPENVTQRFLTLTSIFNAPAQASALGVSIFDRFAPGIEHSLQVLTTSPVLGWGLGSIALGSIDSEYAGQFIYTGLLGFLIFLWVVVRIARTAHDAYRAALASNSPALPMITGLQHCLLGYALYSVFSPSISAARAGAFFFTVLGLVAVLHREVAAAGVREASPADAWSEPSTGALGAPAAEWTV
ncbi:MAG TPA: hypothetical protein VKV57_05785 [bacterium]|nr:hypothetical protein [bacterium]